MKSLTIFHVIDILSACMEIDDLVLMSKTWCTYSTVFFAFQGSVLSIFFWGYSLTQVIGGWLSDNYGSQNVLLYSGFGWAMLTFITPIIVNPQYTIFSPTSSLLLLRFLFGALQGMFKKPTLLLVKQSKVIKFSGISVLILLL